MYDVRHSILKRNPEASKKVAEAMETAREQRKAAEAAGLAGKSASEALTGKLPAEELGNVPAAGQENGMFLFTTKTCPNCKVAKEFLKNEDYKVVDAEENPELSDAYGIMQAPTLVLVKNGKIEKFVNASNIKKFVDARKEQKD